MRDEVLRGVAAMVAASTIWGLSPLFFKLIEHIPPVEILSHRIVWSALIFLGVLAAQRRLATLRAALSSWGGAGRILLAALLISLNWLIFLTAIQTGRAVEASLGYFIFPLVSVLLGRLVFGEAMMRAQALAVTLAALAVAVLTWGLGVAPWIALGVSASFGLYGVAKKSIALGPVVSVTAEVVLLAPLAAVSLALIAARGDAAFGADAADSALLIASGVLTAVPLMLFSYASRRITLATVGLVQYLNPTLQFLCAVLIFVEPFTRWHAIAFSVIWVALAIYSASGWRAARARRKSAIVSATSGALVTKPSSEASAKP